VTPRPSDGSRSLSGNRNWIVAAVLVVAVVLAAGIGQASRPADGGAGLQVSFGAHIQPPAGSNSSLPFNNGWIVTGGTGHAAVAVYAGAQPSNRQNGLLVIQRRMGNTAWRTRTLALSGSGALTLLRPGRPAGESAALQATLHFVTANGGTGTIDLGSDRVSLNG
jgi:hypothetical protein